MTFKKYVIFSFFLFNQINSDQVLKFEQQFQNKTTNESSGLTKIIRDEYQILTKIKRKKLKDKINYVNGYYSINQKNSPFIFDTIEDLCKRLNMETPQAYYFAGNLAWNFISFFSGADLKINAWATRSLIDGTNYICIGEDTLNNLSYDELRAVIAHELSHVKKNHVMKSRILYPIINGFTFTAANLLMPLIPGFGFAVNLGLFNINVGPGLLLGYAAIMPQNALSRKFEKEADLLAFDITQEHTHLINGLENLHKTYEKKHPFWHSIGTANELIFPFQTHPSIEKRTEYLTKAAEKAKQQAQIALKAEYEKSEIKK